MASPTIGPREPATAPTASKGARRNRGDDVRISPTAAAIGVTPTAALIGWFRGTALANMIFYFGMKKAAPPLARRGGALLSAALGVGLVWKDTEKYSARVNRYHSVRNASPKERLPALLQGTAMGAGVMAVALGAAYATRAGAGALLYDQGPKTALASAKSMGRVWGKAGLIVGGAMGLASAALLQDPKVMWGSLAESAWDPTAAVFSGGMGLVAGAISGVIALRGGVGKGKAAFGALAGALMVSPITYGFSAVTRGFSTVLSTSIGGAHRWEPPIGEQAGRQERRSLTELKSARD